ncbi:MAG TPA: nucleotidyltransferase [archaeon]|nr:nucleotidyltransferase [archaeon]
MEKYITDFTQISEAFDEIDKNIRNKINVYLIGGAVLLYHNAKPGTKDIDLIVNSKEEYESLINTLKKNDFTLEKPTREYHKLNLENILIKDNYRFDIFNKIVCNNLFLSENMIKRAKLIKEYKNIKLFACSLEDILVFKSITDRDGDIDDCQSIARTNPNWNVILDEIKYQVEKSGKDVWITWFEERLNLLEDRKIIIPILKDIRKLSLEYYNQLEKKLK